MLIWFVVIYWIISVGVGLRAAMRVKNTADFAAAGHSLPLLIAIAMVFATLFGSAAVLCIPADFIQMIVIGMFYISGEMTALTGRFIVVVEHAAAAGKLFWPDMNRVSILRFTAVLCIMMLVSISQRNVFQRISSSKNVNIAMQALILGGVLYFIFVFVPI